MGVPVEAVTMAVIVFLAFFDLGLLLIDLIGPQMNVVYVTEVFRKWAGETFVAPYSWGVLTGHFFWPFAPVIDNPLRFAILAGTLAIPLFAHEHRRPYQARYAIPSMVVLGAIAGGLLWSAPYVS